MNKIKLFAKKKGSPEKPQSIKGLLYYKPSPFTNYVRDTNSELSTYIKMTFKKRKELEAIAFGFTRISPIRRTRKRQIAKAKHMMAWHDQRVMSGHSGGSKALENRRGGRDD